MELFGAASIPRVYGRSPAKLGAIPSLLLYSERRGGDASRPTPGTLASVAAQNEGGVCR
jgi:hypothetical protein